MQVCVAAVETVVDLSGGLIYFAAKHCNVIYFRQVECQQFGPKSSAITADFDFVDDWQGCGRNWDGDITEFINGLP